MDRDKLIRSKERWAREGRLMTDAPTGRGGRLPPGQHLVRDWPVLDLGNQPNLTTRDWSLSVGGMVERPVTLDWGLFQKLPQIEPVSDIHCVTGWSRYDNRWRGGSTAALIAFVRPTWEARFAILKSYDGYTTCVPRDLLEADDALVATHWDGAPLTREHGGPARLILPRLYLWKSAKWLRSIWFGPNDVPGTWEARGYHHYGDPWKQERYR